MSHHTDRRSTSRKKSPFPAPNIRSTIHGAPMSCPCDRRQNERKYPEVIHLRPEFESWRGCTVVSPFFLYSSSSYYRCSTSDLEASSNPTGEVTWPLESPRILFYFQ